MPSSTAMNFSEQARPSNDREVWQNLKEAIATSSGFQRWLLERQLKNTQHNNTTIAAPIAENLDKLVRSYLRETLETLAY